MSWPTTSRHERGYDKHWDKQRLRILERDKYLCQCDRCKAEKRITPANEVNHIIPKTKAEAMGWTRAQMDDPSNLQAVNKECHRRITKEQQGHTYNPPRKIGLDGFPIE
jgi:5-methylcytosine-specific restriction protein A